jgi:hypothetical protein
MLLIVFTADRCIRGDVLKTRVMKEINRINSYFNKSTNLLQIAISGTPGKMILKAGKIVNKVSSSFTKTSAEKGCRTGEI